MHPYASHFVGSVTHMMADVLDDHVSCMHCVLHQERGGGHDAGHCDPEDRWKIILIPSQFFSRTVVSLDI